MKMTHNNTRPFSILLWGFLALLMACCTPMDYHYSEYLENGEKVYPGRVDSIEFKPGHNRAAIRALLSTDARVSKIRIAWADHHEYETDVSADDISKYKQIVIPEIAEGLYTFEIYTYDNQGHQSMRSEVFGRIYGEQYESDLNNRVIDVITNDIDDELIIHWFPERTDTTLLGTLVTYPTLKGDSNAVFTPLDSNNTVLKDIKPAANFTFTTLYKPTPAAIDTFRAATVDVNPLDYIQPEAELYPRDSWSIVDYSSENNDSNHAVANLLDDRSDTFWIARFSGTPADYPDHYIIIDMNQELDVDGFMFAQKNGDRKIREMEIQISSDNAHWESLGLFGLEDINRDYQYLDLTAPRVFRYFKIIPTAGHDSQKQPGLAEAGTFQYKR